MWHLSIENIAVSVNGQENALFPYWTHLIFPKMDGSEEIEIKELKALIINLVWLLKKLKEHGVWSTLL
jgi:hypothetical protein